MRYRACAACDQNGCLRSDPGQPDRLNGCQCRNAEAGRHLVTNMFGQPHRLSTGNDDVFCSRAVRSLPLPIPDPDALSQAARDAGSQRVNLPCSITVGNDQRRAHASPSATTARLPIRRIDTRGTQAYPHFAWPGFWRWQLRGLQYLAGPTLLFIERCTHDTSLKWIAVSGATRCARRPADTFAHDVEVAHPHFDRCTSASFTPAVQSYRRLRRV